MSSAVMHTALFLAVASHAAVAQGPNLAPISAADSVRIVRRVRAEQISFEAFRRNRLPEQDGSGGADRCDARIGRYCYWRGDDDDEHAPPERPEIIARRAELLGLLDTAAHLVAGDAWTDGQNVRYLVEAGRTDDALRFARNDCRATSYWCAALAGYAAHEGGRYTAADSEFSQALAGMDRAERARWLDIRLLLPDDLADRYSSLDSAAREAFVRRVFWLGAPLYSVSGTDLFTEHLARMTRARMAERSATPDGSSWADDIRDVMLRYGWPTWYSRSRPDWGTMREPTITGHDDGMPYDFLPSLRVVDHPSLASPDDWRLDDRHAQTGYAPRYARSVHDVPHQIVLFRRGDSTLTFATWDARRDTTLIGRTLHAALVLTSEAEHTVLSLDSTAKATGQISTIGVIDSGLVSLELLAPEDRRAARVRVGVPALPNGGLNLSDLLLYSPTAQVPSSLDDVRESALASEVVPASGAIGVYWETYGLPALGKPLHLALTVEQIDVGFLRHVAEALRFADPTTALRIQWDEVPRQTNGRVGQGVRLDVSRLRAGRYRMQLSATDTDGETVRKERIVEIR